MEEAAARFQAEIQEIENRHKLLVDTIRIGRSNIVMHFPKIGNIFCKMIGLRVWVLIFSFYMDNLGENKQGRKYGGSNHFYAPRRPT